MRSLILASVLLWCGVASATVTGTVRSTSLDENGNIMVQVTYVIDGVEVPSPYPMEDGHYVHVFRMAYTNLEGTTLADFVDQNVRQHCEALTQRKANEVENTKVNLSSVIGRSVTVDTVDQQVTPTKILTVRSTGKVSERIVDAPPAPVDIATEIAGLKASIDEVKTSVGVSTRPVVEAVQ